MTDVSSNSVVTLLSVSTFSGISQVVGFLTRSVVVITGVSSGVTVSHRDLLIFTGPTLDIRDDTCIVTYSPTRYLSVVSFSPTTTTPVSFSPVFILFETGTSTVLEVGFSVVGRRVCRPVTVTDPSPLLSSTGISLVSGIVALPV